LRLDPIVQKETVGLLRGLVDERGMGLVLISHDRLLASATADEVIDLS
jgi:peptide/nickel transport system ATP-binding protein